LNLVIHTILVRSRRRAYSRAMSLASCPSVVVSHADGRRDTRDRSSLSSSSPSPSPVESHQPPPPPSTGRCSPETDGCVSGITWTPSLLALVERTGYPLRQENGQRRYGPPSDWNEPIPGRGCEVFVGKLPRDSYEDELVPIFERFGRIYEARVQAFFYIYET